jgi:hypothetical protein
MLREVFTSEIKKTQSTKVSRRQYTARQHCMNLFPIYNVRNLILRLGHLRAVSTAKPKCIRSRSSSVTHGANSIREARSCSFDCTCTVAVPHLYFGRPACCSEWGFSWFFSVWYLQTKPSPFKHFVLTINYQLPIRHNITSATETASFNKDSIQNSPQYRRKPASKFKIYKMQLTMCTLFNDLNKRFNRVSYKTEWDEKNTVRLWSDKDWQCGVRQQFSCRLKALKYTHEHLTNRTSSWPEPSTLSIGHESGALTLN